jgi:putative cardiolipin synthase
MVEQLDAPRIRVPHGSGRHHGTRLERAVRAALAGIGARAAEARGVQSGIKVLCNAADAFAIRAATARAAGSSLDLQYYVWRNDVTGQLLAREVLAAADRGVRVRMLLDDAYAIARERSLAALDTHANIEVRLFNGISWRRLGRWGLPLEMIFGGWHLNHRMHNKNWIADRQLAVVGGRNIGDEYFGVEGDGTLSFRDLDLVLAGPVADQACAVFARYWDSRLARPAALVSPASQPADGLARLRQEMDEAARRPEAAPLLARLGEHPRRHLRRGLALVGDGAAKVIADPPEKARRGLGARRRARRAGGIAPEIAEALRAAKREVRLISPYFVPGKAGLELLLELLGRGVRISLVTNSLAATDVVAVHGAYARYRRPLLRAGAVIHELKPGPDEEGASVLGSRGAALHTKAFVVDGLRAFVGSFNLDHRSAALNTEMGTFVHHPGIAKEVAAEQERLADPAVSWTLELDAAGIAWRDLDPQGAPRHVRSEPVASWRRRVVAWIAAHLPIEEQL